MKLVFATADALSFAQRSDIARRLVAHADLALLGRTSVAWLGALRLAVYFRRDLSAAEVAIVRQCVAHAKRNETLPVAAPVAPAAPKARKPRKPRAKRSAAQQLAEYHTEMARGEPLGWDEAGYAGE